MTPILIFGLLSGVLLDVIVGLLGSRRNIGFGWAFLLSLIFTPLVGLIAVLLSSPLPVGSTPRYGCLGVTFGIFGTILLVVILTAIIFGTLLFFIPVV